MMQPSDGGAATLLVDEIDGWTDLAWSPDRSRIYFKKGGSIYSVSPAAGPPEFIMKASIAASFGVTEYAPEQFYIKMVVTNFSSGRRPRLPAIVVLPMAREPLQAPFTFPQVIDDGLPHQLAAQALPGATVIVRDIDHTAQAGGE